MGYWSDFSIFHIIAHRGASAYAPENSLAAFALASRYSATDIELDLHSTADGEFVVRHGSTLQSQSPRFISELSYEKYSRMCAQQSETSLRLTQVIEVARQNNLGIYLDIKQLLPRTLPNLLALIEDNGYMQKTVIASARTDILKAAKDNTPDCLTSYLFSNPDIDCNSLIKGVGCDFLHPCFDVFKNPLKHFTKAWTARLRETGAGIIAWNINSSTIAEAVISIGVQGACSDDPQIISAALSKTGLE